MDTTTVTSPDRTAPGRATPLKVVVLGGRAVGQASLTSEELFVGMVSELDDEVARQAQTIVPYGQCAVTGPVSVHVYGMPAQNRFWFMWDALSLGAVAALVLADATRLADSFPAIDYTVARGLPFLVAVTGAEHYDLTEVREALAVGAGTPVLLADRLTDPDRPRPARELLRALVRYAVARRHTAVPAA
ncbi:MAG: ATP/GTP-binding protein [Actinocatenispora sp.]